MLIKCLFPASHSFPQGDAEGTFYPPKLSEAILCAVMCLFLDTGSIVLNGVKVTSKRTVES